MKKSETSSLIKTTRKIWVILFVLVLIPVLTFAGTEFINRKAVIKELANDAIEYGMEDYEISIKGKDDYGKYNVIIESDKLEALGYEEIYKIVYHVCSSDAEVIFVSNGNTYTPDSSKLCKNGEVVYSPKSSSSKKCIECGASASRIYHSPF